MILTSANFSRQKLHVLLQRVYGYDMENRQATREASLMETHFITRCGISTSNFLRVTTYCCAKNYNIGRK
jgi:hypothetical protein